MISRNYMALSRAAVACFAALCLLSGCGYFFGPKSQSPAVEVKSEPCFKTLMSELKSWLKSGEPSIGPVVDCAQLAADKFTAKTKGQGADRWSRAEVAQFISYYFGVEASAAGAWMEEIFRAKQALYGGSATEINRSEVARLKTLIARLKPELEASSPYVRIGLFAAEEAKAEEAMKAAERAEKLVAILADEIGRSLPNRPPMAIDLLFANAKRLNIGGPGLASWQSLVISLKSIIAGGEADTVAAAEWPMLLEATGRIWSLAIRLKYELPARQDILGADLPRMESIVRDGLKGIDRAIEAQGGTHPAITSAQIVKLVDALGAKKLLPFGLRTSTVVGLVPKALGKLLYGNHKSDRALKEKSFSAVQAAVLRAAVEDWLAGQKIVTKYVNAESTIDPRFLVTRISSASLTSAAENTVEANARAQLVTLIGRGRTLVRDEESRLQLGSESSLSVRRSDLDLLNAARAGIALLLRGYAHDAAAAADLKGVTDVEAQEIYLDLREFGRDRGMIDVRNNTGGLRTFMEANLFTSAADGGNRINLHKGVEWYHLAFNATAASEAIYAEIADSCAIKGTVDVLGKEKLDPNCFRTRFKQRMYAFLPNMPGFVAWHAKSAAAKKTFVDEFHSAIEEAARPAGYTEALFDSSDLRALMPILFYAESLFTWHDKNKNDILDAKEVWGAFPIVQPFIRKVGDGKAETLCRQEAVYSFMLDTGEPPSTDLFSWTSARVAQACSWWGLAKDETADRLKIVKIIGSFAKFARHKRARDIMKFLDGSTDNFYYDVKAGSSTVIADIANLFQCQESARTLLAEVLRVRIDEAIRPGKRPEPARFIQAMKTIIYGDPRFSSSCLPF